MTKESKAEEILENHTLWQGEKAVRTEEDMLLAMGEYAEWKLKNCNLQCATHDVVRHFCVSVVYQKQNPGNILKLALRAAVVEAVSKEEALGIVINNLSEEFTDWLLTLKCVIKL